MFVDLLVFQLVGLGCLLSKPATHAMHCGDEKQARFGNNMPTGTPGEKFLGMAAALPFLVTTALMLG